MKRMKPWLSALLVVIAPPVLLFLSNWGYSSVTIYRSLHFAAWPQQLFTMCVYTALGIVLGFLMSRFTRREQRRLGLVSFTGGLLLLVAFGVLYALYRRESVTFPTWIRNIFAMFDLREMYFWGGVYLLQIIRRTQTGGKVRLQPAGEAAASLPYGSRGNTAAMLCVILLPALLLLVSAYALSVSAAQAQNNFITNIHYFLLHIPYWNIVFYSLLGVLFGAVPWLCRAEEKRLRCAVAVTFGLAGVMMVGMLHSVVYADTTSLLAFLTYLNLKEVFLWVGLYLYLMASLLRQGYREKNQNSGE